MTTVKNRRTSPWAAPVTCCRTPAGGHPEHPVRVSVGRRADRFGRQRLPRLVVGRHPLRRDHLLGPRIRHAPAWGPLLPRAAPGKSHRRGNPRRHPGARVFNCSLGC